MNAERGFDDLASRWTEQQQGNRGEKIGYYKPPVLVNVVQDSIRNIKSLINEIKNSRELAEICGKIRAIKDPDHKKQKKLRNKIKEKELPFITPHGICHPSRKKENFKEHSGVNLFDVDDLGPDDVAVLKGKFINDPFVVFCFISPGSEGLKFGAFTDAVDQQSHDLAWAAQAQYFMSTYTIKIDTAPKSVASACFLSSDPDAYFNPKAKVFDGKAADSPQIDVDKLRTGTLWECIADLDPKDQGDRYEVRCPGCGRHEAYIYKKSDDTIRCAHKDTCNFSERLIIGESLATTIDSVRRVPEKKLHSLLKLRKIHQMVLDDLITAGAFLRETESGELLYFDIPSRHIFEVVNLAKGNSEFELFQNEKFKILHREKPELNLFLQSYANAHGRPVQVSPFVHFDEKIFKLFISDFDGGFFEITPESIEHKAISLDGILFKPCPDFKPYAPTFTGSETRYFKNGLAPEAFKESLLYKLLISRASLIDAFDFGAADKRLILLVYFYSMFFRDVMPTRPILLFNGERGSGKTFFGRSLGRVLFGEHFEVLPLPKSDDDLRVVAMHNPLIVLDNCDTYTRQTEWFRDTIATISTGSRVQKRQLYSDSAQASIRTDTYLIATSRSPLAFQRDDIADRTIVFDVEKIINVIDENQLKSAILQNRNGLWAEILVNLQDLVALYRNFKNKRTYNFRMGDFARIMDIFLNDPTETDRLLNCIKLKSENFSIDDHPFFIALGTHIADHDTAQGNAKQIVEMIFDKKERETEKNLPIRFSKWARTHLDELKRNFDLEIEKTSRGVSFRFAQNTSPENHRARLKERQEHLKKELSAIDSEMRQAPKSGENNDLF